MIAFKASSSLPTLFGRFRLDIFADATGHEHMAIIAGTPAQNCLVRLHSECATGDILGSLRCDCRDQLELSLEKIADAGCGVVIYLRGHEGRGIGLANKIKAYALQEQGRDTVDANLELGFAADARDYAAAIGVLRHYGLTSVRLMTNNRLKLAALTEAGIRVTSVPHWTAAGAHNQAYIATKKSRMGHA